MTDLMQLHAQLKSSLGAAYSDAWIEDGRLYVAVTSSEAEAAVRAAGANPCRAQFTAKELQDAVRILRAWLATEAAPPAQLHWIGVSGRTASITVRVPADQVQALANAVARQKPTGAVEVIVEQSSGPATPLAAKLPQKGE